MLFEANIEKIRMDKQDLWNENLIHYIMALNDKMA